MIVSIEVSSVGKQTEGGREGEGGRGRVCVCVCVCAGLGEGEGEGEGEEQNGPAQRSADALPQFR